MGCRLIKLSSVKDFRGSLTFMEGNNPIPFEIKRIYYVYGVPPGENRGAHANIISDQIIIAVGGSFTVTADDGQKKKIYEMSSPEDALYVPAKVWVDIENFSEGAVMLVLRPNPYDKNDYVRNYEEFRKMVGK